MVLHSFTLVLKVSLQVQDSERYGHSLADQADIQYSSQIQYQDQICVETGVGIHIHTELPC